MENYPNRHRNHEIETLSDRFLKNHIPVSWITNPFQIDYGTDYNCEITSERQVTGNNFSIQLKGKETEQNQDSIKIILKRTNINRWLNRLEPTIIIVYIVDENEAYWKWFEDNTVDLTQSNDNYTVSIPRENKLSKLNWTVISEHVKLIFSKRHLLYELPKIDDQSENGWNFFYENKFVQALSEFYEITKKKPDDTSILEAIAISEYNLFNYQKALVFINKAIEVNNTKGFNLTKASILTEQGSLNNDNSKINDAIEIYKNIIMTGVVSSEVFYNYGSALSIIKEYAISIEYFNKALELNPNKPEIWNNLGNAYMNLGNHQSEMICYNKALQINPNLAETLFSKGSSLFRYFGKIDEGLTLMLTATDVSDRHEIDNANVFFWIAEAYLVKDDIENAFNWNKKGLLNFSSNNYLKTQKLRIEIVKKNR
ncbi:DUF4365 domain-containing protein [Kaistella sp.]|uniref:DUF4365 domain-containing protein n=1 Tax=Kaistella sp. TaxID=2782235 RepID=UPI003C4E879E